MSSREAGAATPHFWQSTRAEVEHDRACDRLEREIDRVLEILAPMACRHTRRDASHALMEQVRRELRAAYQEGFRDGI